MDAVSGKTVGRFTTNRGTTPTIPHLWHKYNLFILRLQGIFYRPFLPFPSVFHSFSHFFHNLQNICSTFGAQKNRSDTTSCVRPIWSLPYILLRFFAYSRAHSLSSKRTKEALKFRQFSPRKIRPLRLPQRQAASFRQRRRGSECGTPSPRPQRPGWPPRCGAGHPQRRCWPHGRAPWSAPPPGE